jgi:hypothetical protein
MSFLKHLFPTWKRGLEDKTKANAAILAAIDRELTDTEQATIQSKLLLSLDTSSGEWLDQYGNLFGVLRKDGEQDEDYRQRIINYVLLHRGTIPAIKDAIREFLQDYESEIEIYEPYTNVFMLNKSKLNGEDHLLGHYYTVAVIDIKFSRPFPAGIIDVINEFKPAGVTVHLTFRPNGYNPDAPIVGDGIPDDKRASQYLNLYTMAGLDDRIRGHLNLTARSRGEGDESGLFILNSSKLNSTDRLAGSFSASNATYNIASYSTTDLVFTEETTTANVLEQTEPLSSDFYTKTGQLTDAYASQTVSGNEATYLYFTLDAAAFLQSEYPTYLRELQPSGVYTKETYLSLMEHPSVLFYAKAAVPPANPTTYQVQILNLSAGKWETLDTKQAHYKVVGGNTSVNNFSSSLSNSGLTFVRIKIDPNPFVTQYDFQVHMFELGFKKEMGSKIMLHTGAIGVSSDHALNPIPES